MIFYIMLVVLCNIYGSTWGYIEKVVATGCESCALFLTCRHLNSIIAILETEFVPNDIFYKKTNSVNKTQLPFQAIRPRDVLNQRCSGVNHCSFILREDCPGTEHWGKGNITVKYACISEEEIRKYCNSVIRLPGKFTTGISEGFIHNPGYPRFYSGQMECRWNIIASSYQKIKLTLLDVALFDNQVSSSLYECHDIMEIRDSGQVIYSTCQQNDPPTEVISASESVEIVLQSKRHFNPRRGIFIHYTTLGCPTLLPPKNGFLEFKNQTMATFQCCIGFYFPDTGEESRTITCLGAFWNVPLPLIDCEKPANGTQVVLFSESVSKPKYQDMAVELIAPIVIIIGLFAINAVVLFYINKAKKKQAMEINEEELRSFAPVNRTPTV